MHALLHFLRRFFGGLFLGIGFVMAVVGLCGAGVCAFLWFKGELISEKERGLWPAAVALVLVGGAIGTAGGFLARRRGLGAGVDDTLRLRRSRREHRSPGRNAAFGTGAWLTLAATVLWANLPGEPSTRGGHTLLGLILVYLGSQAVILCHELGHLSVAILLGMDRQKLQVGTGPLLIGGKLGGLRVQWRALLGGGFVQVGQREERGWRWRHWCFVAGGPLAHAAAGAGLAWWLAQRGGPGDWFTNNTHDAPGLAALCVSYYAACIWLGSVLPFAAIQVGAVRTHSDGYWLGRTPRLPQSQVQASVINASLTRAELLWEDNQRAAAWNLVRATGARYPDQPALGVAESYFWRQEENHEAAAASCRRWLGTANLASPIRMRLCSEHLLALARTDQAAARDFCDEALREATAADRAELLDTLASTVLCHDLADFLSEADRWSEQALALEPASITRQGTRGAVLVARGNLAAGETLLREVWNFPSSRMDAALSAFYLGVAAARQDRGRERRRWAARATRLAPYAGSWLAPRIARELS